VRLKNNIKIILIGQLPPPVHGSNVMAALFTESLQKLGHEVEIIQKTFSRTMNEVEKISFLKVLKIFTICYQLLQSLRSRRPDLCFYFNTVKLRAFVVDALFLLILRFFKVPYILYSHGKGLRHMGVRSNPFSRALVQKTLRGATGALVLGERLKEDLTPYLEAKRLFVLPNAIPDQTGGQVPSRPQKNPTVKILFLANLKESKGPWEFLQMAREVAAKAPQARFIMAGPRVNEDFYRRLLDFIAKENLEALVAVPGGLYGADKERVYCESDIFVFPTYNEAFPLVNLEAMQWELPVVSSDEGAIPEVVMDGVTGYIVNPRDIGQLTDRVLRLVHDPELRLRMGKAGRQRYEEHYSIEAYRKNLAKALEYFNGFFPINQGHNVT